MSSKKNVESSPDKNESKNRGWPKGKRRYPKGIGAPKQPLSGYVHFLNERRENVRTENPEITFSELSKKLAAEWSRQGDQEKTKYNELAKKDKDRYDKEFADYQNTDAYKLYIESQRNSENGDASPNKKKKKKGAPVPSKRSSFDESDGEREDPPALEGSTFHIPIFTEEFLGHNKARENELRQLRKQTTEFDEQNAVLGKHIDSMKAAISKLEVETLQQRQNNASLQQHLEAVRQLVLQGFKGVQVPGLSEPLGVRNVDDMVSILLNIMTENPGLNQSILNTAKDIVARLDYANLPS